uniref:Uncharacterized protein n=1 Tax=Acrobeloides nanus TaxID=290746 RepID=A0A914EN20_9BILA
MFNSVIRVCAKQIFRPVFVLHSHQNLSFLSVATTPISKRFFSKEKNFKELCPTETFSRGGRRYFLNLKENEANKDVILMLTELLYTGEHTKRTRYILLAPSDAKKILKNLKEAKNILDQGIKQSDDEEFAYVSQSFQAKPSKDGDKQMEFTVKLRMMSEKYTSNNFLILGHNKENNKNSVVSIIDDGIQDFIKALEELLRKYDELKPTENAQ